jgi:hypothetical protein
MKTAVAVLFAIFLTGCGVQYYQTKMNSLDAHWRAENEPLIKSLGTRYYKVSKQEAHAALLLTLTNLEMTIENQDLEAGYILARGRMPRPLTHAEMDRAWAIDGPRARQITGLPISLSGRSDVIINALLLPRKEDVQINISFRTEYKGNTQGVVISDQAPPEAVKIGYPKIWDEFERVLFVQDRVLKS